MLLCVCLSPQLRWSLGANRGGVIDVAAVTHRVSAAVTATYLRVQHMWPVLTRRRPPFLHLFKTPTAKDLSLTRYTTSNIDSHNLTDCILHDIDIL